MALTRKFLAALGIEADKIDSIIDAHMTNGMQPIHMLKRAVEEHKDEYRQIIIMQYAKALPKGK